jgi:hypothetical protein
MSLPPNTLSGIEHSHADSGRWTIRMRMVSWHDWNTTKLHANETSVSDLHTRYSTIVAHNFSTQEGYNAGAFRKSSSKSKLEKSTC